VTEPPRRRRALTPFESELRFDDPFHRDAPKRPRLRRRKRRERLPPTTLRGAILHAVVRLTVVVAIATGVAVLVDHLADRPAAFGFYVVGAFVLLAGFMLSSADMGTRYYISRGEREQRVRMSFSYVLAGFVIIAVAVAVDTVAH
jgi:hypothetical protein